MPRRRRKSRLRKRDFMVFSGEQTSSILKTNKDFGMSRRRGLLAKAKRTIRRAAHAVASVLALPFIGIYALAQWVWNALCKTRKNRGRAVTTKPPAQSAKVVNAGPARQEAVEAAKPSVVMAAVAPLPKKQKPLVYRPQPDQSEPKYKGKIIDFNRKKQKAKKEQIAESVAKKNIKQQKNLSGPKPLEEKATVSAQTMEKRSGWKKRLAVGILGCLVCAALGWGGWYYFEGRYVYLSVDDNGTVTQIRTATPNVEEMLAEAGIVLEADDVIDTPLETELADEMAVHIIRAKTITIDTGDGKQVQTKLAQGTLQQALEKAGVSLGADDLIDTPLDTEITEDMSVAITRAKEIRILAKAGDTTVMLAKGTVKDALDKSGLEYDTEDEISPSLDTEIRDGMTVSLVRLAIRTETRTEKIAFETVEKKSNRVERGETEISQKGEQGVRTIKEKVVYKDGKEVKRVETSNEVTKEPVNKVVLIGTGPPMNPAVKGLPETPTSSMVIRKVTVDQITAYTHTGRRTATGKWPKVGMCAVNPRIFGYGTMFYVPGYGYAVAEDTGANDSSLVSIDLFMDTKEDCLRWGRKRNVTVTICRRP